MKPLKIESATFHLDEGPVWFDFDNEGNMIYDFVHQNKDAMDGVRARCKAKAMKKPVELGFFVLDAVEHFVTGSGTQTGKSGDYVLVAVDHAWPISKEYFAANYEILEDVQEKK